MKYLLSLIIGFISLSLSANEISFNNEKVNYKVMYKCTLEEYFLLHFDYSIKGRFHTPFAIGNAING